MLYATAQISHARKIKLQTKIKCKKENKFSLIPTNMKCAKENILTHTTIKVELSMNKLHCACKTPTYSLGKRHKNPRLCLE